ncbi:pre-mRNA-splicing factor 38A [Labeo rohita]|uniref:Pre-mRNA-splicing factor 38B n=1 Tax=Labeo rohita TaxID=84645 RepID=A0A498NVD2_LABRO|nr:pre-mRNA-splicing factor 38A [Labeo rohita]
MANRTVKDANSIHGTNPQYLVEKIIRTRIYESKYWKEECFGLTAELVVDKAMELKFVGGVYGGNIKPTPFLCLTLKMLQIQPEKDIIVEFIKNEDFKYVRLLGAMYMRLTGTSVDCYKYLEPLYNDYRKIKSQNRNGEFELMHVDEFIDELLHAERVCDVILPRLQPERVQTPEPHRRSYRDMDRPRRSPSPRYRRSRSPRRSVMAQIVHGADHLKDEVHHPDVIEIGIVTAAKAPVDTAADPGIEGIAPNLQVTTEVTGIAVTPSPQKVGQRRVTREVEEETSNLGFFFFFFLPFFCAL